MKFTIGEVNFSLTRNGASVQFERDGHKVTASIGLPTPDMPTLDISVTIDGVAVEISIPKEV